MHIHAAQPLFAWGQLEDCPTLAFNALARRLGQAVPALGRPTAGDATTLNARPKTDPKAVQAEIAQGLPQPSGGRKEYTDDDGRVTKVVEWFGYKLHLGVDVQHEVTLAYPITDTKVGDNERVAALVEQAESNLPVGRMETLAYDKAADDEAVQEVWHGHGIKQWTCGDSRRFGGRRRGLSGCRKVERPWSV